MEERRMLTVICYDERIESVWKQYDRLFSTFLKKGKICICKWHRDGQSINEAFPELYDCVGNEREWRIIIVNHEMAEGAKNPYEFFKSEVSIEETEKNPLIRVTHMLSEIPEYYDMELIYQGDEQFVSSDDEQDDIYYYRKDKRERCVRKDRGISKRKSKYVLECEPPQQIILMTSRIAQEKKMLRYSVETKNFWNIQPDFWSYNEYPKNVRFIVTDIGRPKSKLDERELFLWIHGIMLMAVNELSSSSLEAYRVYCMKVQADSEKMSAFFSDVLNQQKELRMQLKKEKEALNKDSKEKEAETIPQFNKAYAVDYPFSDLAGLNVDMGNYSYAKDIPQLDEVVWKNNKTKITEILERIQREITRALEQSLGKIRYSEKTEFTKPNGEYSKYQIEDIQSLADDLEIELCHVGVAESIDMVQTKKKLKEIDGRIQNYMAGRLNRRNIWIGIGLAIGVFLAGFFPMICKSFGDVEAMQQILLLVAISGILFFASGWAAVKFNQWKLKVLMEEYQKELDHVDERLKDNRLKVMDYITKAFNYRDAWHFLYLVQQNKRKKELSSLPEYQMLIMHEGASNEVEKMCEKILRMFSLTKKKHESRTYTGELKKYRFDVMPDETDYYEFPNEEKNSLLLVNADECQIYPLFCYISGFSLDKEENYE